ncbi:hypothetical protein OUQ99_11355 [Streptomonospora nanhaiensis]|uniref:Uncharacterized protein n=1 Tax=Streptomonospora nanhaiensis TaxID=1323731 RepID=A0ABY6YUV3_9ACTN|nr:hypothetical protein [Streptomonospora nanhaiensis]WAE75635.1 hypothetical protein OUQ99_11355 [Streptomonospora nanhaiensis]
MTNTPKPPELPAGTSSSITAPTCASRSKYWSAPSRSPLSIWTCWISAPKVTLAVATAKVVSVMNWATWLQTIATM